MVTIEADGQITFVVQIPDASSVAVVGAFGGWDVQRHPMNRISPDEWTLTLETGPGEYLFYYDVDRERRILDTHAHGIRWGSDGNSYSRVWLPPSELTPDSMAA